MSRRYTETMKVQLHDVGPGGILKISSLFNYLQAMAGAQSSSQGYASIDILKEGLTWVISRYRLQINSLPKLFQEFSITTWRAGESGAFALREYSVTDSSGNIMVKGTSSWLLMNFLNGERLKPSHKYPDYPVDTERAITDSFESIPVAPSSDYAKEFTVRRCDLDPNNHVNNSFYPSWMIETGEDINGNNRPVDISVNFKGEARYGDIVVSQVTRDTENKRLIHRLILKDSGKELTRGITVWG